MKRINRRGFTLIELLAVIVILAIILVVTIPSVINTMNDAKTKSLQNAADAVEEWYTKQYELSTLGSGLANDSVDEAYIDFMKNEVDDTDSRWFSQDGGKELLQAAGLSNVEDNFYLPCSKVKFNPIGTICIKLSVKNKTNSNFYVQGADNCKCSSGCNSGCSCTACGPESE